MLTPIKIDNRMNGFLGTPAGAGKKPVVIHLHERYGIVEHTTDLGQKFVDAGYVTIVPDFFSRFTGDREALARGDDRCDLSDEQVLVDLDAVVAYLHALPEADMTKIAMSGVCQTGRQPILAAAKRNLFSAAVVLYGAVYDADWKSHPMRPESIEKLLQEISCPLTAVFGELDDLLNLVRDVANGLDGPRRLSAQIVEPGADPAILQVEERTGDELAQFIRGEERPPDLPRQPPNAQRLLPDGL